MIKDLKKMGDRELDAFVSSNMQKDFKDRHPQTMDAKTEQNKRRPSRQRRRWKSLKKHLNYLYR